MSSAAANPLEGRHDAPPIFVVGFPRSGTTLLQALIGSHPRIASPPEMHYLRRVAAFADFYGDVADDEVLRTVIEATLDWPGARHSDVVFDREQIFTRAAAGPRTYGGVLAAVMQEFAAQNGKTRWCEKTPLQPADLIWQHFPDAQLVHIVRDPRDTIASATEKIGIWRDAPTAARRWQAFTQRTMRQGSERGPRHYLRVRYEDLALDPAAVLAVVFTFLREEFDPSIVNDVDSRRASVFSADSPWQSRVLQPVTASTEGAWQQQLARRDRLRVTAVVEPMVLGLGYVPARRRSVVAGMTLNCLAFPGDWLSQRRLVASQRRQNSPQERFEAHRQTSKRLVRDMNAAASRSADSSARD